MSRKEERINALQNIGGALFISGIIGCVTIDSCIALIISWGLVSAGSLVIFICEHMLDRLEQPEEKNKGQHHHAHDLYH